MGAGVATDPVRRAVPSRQSERGGERVIPATLWSLATDGRSGRTL